MALYTYIKATGQFIPLTQEEINSLRQIKGVARIKKSSDHAANVLLILAQWLASVENKTVADLSMARLPNRVELRVLANELRDGAKSLKVPRNVK